MRKLRERVARVFDRRAAILLVSIFAVLGLDLLLTLRGQSAEYWDHFLRQGIFPGAFDGFVNELALFGFGERLLRLHPLMFVLAFIIYGGIIGSFIMVRRLEPLRLTIYWVFIVAHLCLALTWVGDGYSPDQGWAMEVSIIVLFISFAAYIERRYLGKFYHPESS